MIGTNMVIITSSELELLLANACEKAVKNALSEKLQPTNIEFITVKEAAKFLRVSSETIYRMVDAKEVKYKKIGAAIRIIKSSLV